MKDKKDTALTRLVVLNRGTIQSEMIADNTTNGSPCGYYRTPYPTRHPKLGVSAVLRAKSASPSVGPLSRNFESPLRLDETPLLTCRYRPGLRPIRIIDMAHFRLKRKQLSKTQSRDEKGSDLRRSSTLVMQSRRQPLKAYQQNTLPYVAPSQRQHDLVFPTLDQQDVSKTDFAPPLQPYPAGRCQRISTNPKVRRHSSSDVSSSRCAGNNFADQSVLETDNGRTRKRRSMPVRPGKKIKSRDSLDSTESTSVSVTNAITTSTKTSIEGVKVGVMTRIRSQTQLAYEAVKRVVRKHSKRRSGSYELQREAEDS
ncbi:hypothetical protein TcWFU_004454 [Taenia crassiceps]|uniref:Uncharacterized protein n=1 Tax=Taenia crassiceps TaxID=6207 RepID=A0ABR4QRC5_9CEST